MMMPKKIFFKLLLPILVIAYCVRLIIFGLFPASMRPDEIYQFLEPAHQLAFHTSAVTWEWRAGIRSWLVPYCIAPFFQFAAHWHIQNLLFFIRSIFSILFLIVIFLFCWAGWLKDKKQGLLIFGLIAALWPDFVRSGGAVLGEIIGGNFLVDGVLLSYIALLLKERQSINHILFSFLIIISTLFLSLAVIVRFQFAPASVISFLYILLKISNMNRLCSLIIFSIPIIFLGIFDKITLGSFYQSIFKNYYMNINLGIANNFGSDSVIFYFKKFIFQWGVMILPIIYFCKKTWRENSYPLFIGLFVIFYHSLISHKEFGFIYPSLPLIVFCASFGLDDLCQKITRPLWQKISVLSLGLVCFFLSNYVPDLKISSEFSLLEAKAAKQNDVCGVAILASPDDDLGNSGHEVLPLSVPLYMAYTEKELDSLKDKYNYLIAYQDTGLVHKEMIQMTCGNDTSRCLYKIPNKCLAGSDFNQFSYILKSIGK